MAKANGAMIERMSEPQALRPVQRAGRATDMSGKFLEKAMALYDWVTESMIDESNRQGPVRIGWLLADK